MPEKLLTIKEVASYLGVSEDEVKRLVDIGEVPAYRIGGSFLRFRKEQIDAIKTEVKDFENEESIKMNAGQAAMSDNDAEITEEQKIVKPRERVVVQQYDYSFIERIKDFFYFYDFYIISFLLIGLLMFVIFGQT